MGKKTGRHVCYIVVDSAGKLEDVDPVRAAPDSVVLFIMSNEHATSDMKVEIKDFKRKETMTTLNPIATAGSLTRNLSPGEVDSIKVKLHPKAKFGSTGGLLPYTTYKYTVEVTDLTLGGMTPYDPDIDVPPA
jgi:hypothetical protein